MVVKDETLDFVLKQGYLHCYCYAKFVKNPLDTDEVFPDGIKHCEQWSSDYITTTFVKTAAPLMIVVINVFLNTLFSILSGFEKQFTKNH
jgi:hypothetical protein